VILTTVPGGPEVGRKDVTLGSTVNAVELVAVPAGVVTVIGPVTAATGTIASIRVSEATVNDAVAPPKATAVAPVNPVPRESVGSPAGPIQLHVGTGGGNHAKWTSSGRH
jgi:hypothetical protein